MTVHGAALTGDALSLPETVRRFYSDWSVVSPMAIAAYFSPDAVLQTPLLEAPLLGAPAIAGQIEIFRARFENVDVEILAMASSGQTVLCEHLWRYQLTRGKKFQLPMQASFTFKQGEICVWRSYFDPRVLTGNVDLGES